MVSTIGATGLRLICDSEQGSEILCASVYGAALHLTAPEIMTLHAGVGGEAQRFTAQAAVVELTGLSRGGQCTWDVYVAFDPIKCTHTLGYRQHECKPHTRASSSVRT